jgi:signal transduction histidine kinase
MAVVRIADYYSRFREKTLGWLIFTQVVSVCTTIALVWALLDIANIPFVYAVIISGSLFISVETIVLVITFRAMTEPLKLITQAINHVSKQVSDLPPPSINAPRHVRSGLKSVVQTIYDLALSPPSTETVNDPAITKMAGPQGSAILDALPCGVIGLNAAGDVIFHNKNAPIRTNPDQTKDVELLFESNNSLSEWLKSASTKLRDQTSWSRIPNRLPDDDGRRIFDVIVEHEQDAASGIETLIITVDRTGTYAEAEEDMDFIALAAHELRGPITVIRGYLDVLNDELQPVLQPDQHELIDRLSVSASRLSGYINNILNVSRYDRRHLKLHLHEDTLTGIIDSLRIDLDLRARTQNRLLSFNIPADLPTVAADRNSLGEVISNLVDNAIKYSNEGGQVNVTAAVKGDFVECSVRDFGIGMPASVTGDLFGKFYRSHLSRQTVAGTGLGLYISKAIIESHGGQIWVSSTEGQGSTFGFTVPVYATVADKLLASDNDNEGIIESAHGWIKNHSMVRK